MDEEQKSYILINVHNYLKSRGFDSFRAKLENMKPPERFVEKRTGEFFQPDMTAHLDGSLCIFEIEMGEMINNEKGYFIRKCKVFEKQIRSKRGLFYIIVPVEQFEMLLATVEANNFENVGYLKLENAHNNN